MQDELVSRSRGCLLGLAVGDALGGPTEGKSLQSIQRQWGRVTGFLSDDQTGSDDTEYALFNALLLIKHGPSLSALTIADEWKKELVNASNRYKGAGFSEMLTIRNLKAGLLPPHSGRHLHSWSDGLAMRVAPFGIVEAGRPELAARLAEMDGSVSNAGEGILSGRSVAAAVAQAMTGSPLSAIIDAALHVIPVDSWTRRAIDRAVAVAASSPDVWNALAPLNAELVNNNYHWSDIAPEAVAMAFGILVASRGNFSEAVLGAVNIGRDTDTIAGIVGAIIGAQQGITTIPAEWARRVAVSRGVCLGVVKGMNIEATADRLAQVAESWRTSQ